MEIQLKRNNWQEYNSKYFSNKKPPFGGFLFDKHIIFLFLKNRRKVLTISKLQTLRCVMSRKDTNLKAIHNPCCHVSTAMKDVLCHAKIQI